MIDEMEYLEAVRSSSKQFNLPENAQKPCISLLLQQSIREGFRNESIHIVATDLMNRQRLSEESALNILLRWNEKFCPPLGDREVYRTVIAAQKTMSNGKQRTYGCNGKNAQTDHCCGKDNCEYYQLYFAKSNKSGFSISAFINSRQFVELDPFLLKLYLTLIRIEKKRSIKAGSLILVSQRTLEKESGITRQSIATMLPKLHFAGLIEFKKGKQHKFHKQASEVRRIIPVPDTVNGQLDCLPCVNKITT